MSENTVTVEIKSRWDARVLFSAEISVEIGEQFRLRAAQELAVKARANLARANLARAYLDGAYLDGAYLARANLARAYLDGAYLAGGEKLVGERPILQLGPIGSASRYFVAYLTNKGLRLRAGCFFGSRGEFVAQLSERHENNIHAQEYTAALALIDEHARLWTPAMAPETEAAA